MLLRTCALGRGVCRIDLRKPQRRRFTLRSIGCRQHPRVLFRRVVVGVLVIVLRRRVHLFPVYRVHRHAGWG